MYSCTIIVTEAMAKIHNCTSVMMPGTWDFWLDPANADTDAVAGLLVPAPPSVIRTQPVSTGVNNTSNNGAHLIAEVQPAGV